MAKKEREPVDELINALVWMRRKAKKKLAVRKRAVRQTLGSAKAVLSTGAEFWGSDRQSDQELISST
jgi:hypothetical protein